MKSSYNWGRSPALFAILIVLLFAARPLKAQVDTGSIQGTVSDQSGGVVADASVTLTSERTGAALTTTTSSDGVYKFSPVKIGSYKVEVSFKGFETITATGLIVNVGTEAVQNFTLKAGNVTQSIEVSAAPPYCSQPTLRLVRSSIARKSTIFR